MATEPSADLGQSAIDPKLTPNAMGFLPMRAVEWRVGPDPSPLDHREIRIVEQIQRDGRVLYAVKEGPWAANHDREWEYEPVPSSRDDAYLARCRWDKWEDVALVAQHMAKETFGV